MIYWCRVELQTEYGYFIYFHLQVLLRHFYENLGFLSGIQPYLSVKFLMSTSYVNCHLKVSGDAFVTCNQIFMDVLFKRVILHVEFSCCWLRRILPFSKASLDSTNGFQSSYTAWPNFVFLRRRPQSKEIWSPKITKKFRSSAVELLNCLFPPKDTNQPRQYFFPEMFIVHLTLQNTR